MGLPIGALSQWMLGLVAVTTFVTAVHRVVWISGRLRPVGSVYDERASALIIVD